MATAKYTIIYEDDGTRYKLLKLMLTDDGSYFATCPYHESDRVTLAKTIVNYVDPARRATDKPIELAVLNDDLHRLKLSHHPDGFVQFSGHGIRSGRNADGSPKGLGIKSFPLNRPTAGPAFGLTVMNPRAFKEAGAPDKTDVVFKRSDLFEANVDNGLIIESFYFRPEWRRFVKKRDGSPIILLRHPSGALLELRVCPPPDDNWRTGFLGVDLWSVPVRLGEGPSGFAMSSPAGDLHYNDEGQLEGVSLFASYPALPEDVSVTPAILTFAPREDPAYRQGEYGPTEDVLTAIVREGRRRGIGTARQKGSGLPESSEATCDPDSALTPEQESG